MPDNDIFRRYVARPWRRATVCFHGDMEPDEVAPMLMKGAARSLSSSGGLPALPALVEVYWLFLQKGVTPNEALGKLRQLQADGFHNRNIQLGVRAVGRLITAPQAPTGEFDDCAQKVAAAFLSELIDHNVLDPSIPEVENLRRFPTLADRYERADRCRAEIAADGRLDGLATALRKNPTCARLRLPKSDKPTPTTEQFLASSIG